MSIPLLSQISGPQSPTPTVVRRFAIVVSTSPLRVRYEADDEPLDATPISLVPDLAVGHRVRVELDNGQLIILGRTHSY